MPMIKKVILKKGRETSVLRRHPWIFSGGIYKTEGAPEPGDLVSVYSAQGDPLGIGHYQDSSISVRLLNFQTENLPDHFWQDRLAAAWRFRRSIGLPDSQTSMFRLVHGEGDGLPGLIIDIYGETAVIQFHDIGMFRAKKEIVDALQSLEGLSIGAIYNKSSDTLHGQAGQVKDEYLLGSRMPGPFLENGIPFEVNWETGQKTGFFLDQRDNRALVARYSQGRKVLNAFSYTGGFSLYALSHGASSVVSMDISQPALDQAKVNSDLLNKKLSGKHRIEKADVVKSLKEGNDTYDMIILDPPAFAKRMSARHNAIQAYKRLNATAMEKLPSGGLLFTFSCSQVVTRQIFEDTVLAAALEVNRPVRILHLLSQGPDHPVNIYHPESEYLKGLAIQIE